ncbi:MAG TPA: bifunctional phosphopantothenoylcysteine decarboxylase/phosphopantothenate--cysteine ligase CoaBC [Cytophagales bacterium]|nr:bifunctional phosphopantothenoylcysteine decarboxylase/phosphopantothenate--cysteine ligase CoaBC [Cytophagales bacterium]
MNLEGRKIVLAVTGSIAAYKSAHLVRLLGKEGATVKVLMTPSAHDFITPLTLSTLSKNPVLTSFSEGKQGEWNNHVELGLWAEVMIIAPLSANTLGKMVQGICDNLVLATYLSARCPVIMAPAMDLDMLQHPSTLQNLEAVARFGNHLVEPGVGELASGLIGKGRMAEPEEIVDYLITFFRQQNRLAGKTALVTAGPTHEAIDPVRFIGNNSTGKMGYAIAEALAASGAEVQVVSGPTHLALEHPRVSITRVTSAREMYDACQQKFPTTQIAVLSAAVADYRPVVQAQSKIKKSGENITLELTQNPDIAAELGRQKKAGQFVVGFALETDNERANAEKKLATKNFDLIVLNSLRDAGAGFGHDTNKVTVMGKEAFVREFPLKSKKQLAYDIVDTIIQHVGS